MYLQTASQPNDKMINVIIRPVFFSYPKHIHHCEINTRCNYHIDSHGQLMHNNPLKLQRTLNKIKHMTTPARGAPATARCPSFYPGLHPGSCQRRSPASIHNTTLWSAQMHFCVSSRHQHGDPLCSYISSVWVSVGTCNLRRAWGWW